jgi:hypothetical protein
MHDPRHGSHVRSCSREQARGNEYLGRGQDAHHHSMGTAALDGHRGGHAIVRGEPSDGGSSSASAAHSPFRRSQQHEATD